MPGTNVGICLSRNQQQILAEIAPPLDGDELSYLGGLGLVNPGQSIFQGIARTSIIYDTEEVARKYVGSRRRVDLEEIARPLGAHLVHALNERRFPGGQTQIEGYEVPQARW